MAAIWCYLIYQHLGAIREDDRVLLICHFTTIFALIDIVAGILMIVGVYKVRTTINFPLFDNLIL